MPLGSIKARHLAAVLDNVLAAVACVVAGEQLPDQWLVAQAISATIAFRAYFPVIELICAATPAKLIAGLKVLRFDGGRCTPGQILIRSLFRILEVNPLLLGGLPAAVNIVLSPDRQRFGDKFAGTIVVAGQRFLGRLPECCVALE